MAEQRLVNAANAAIENQVDQVHGSKTREYAEQIAARYACDDTSIMDAEFDSLADNIEWLQFGKVSAVRS